MDKETKIKSSAQLEGKVLLILTEQEARALKNITVYGHEYFTKWFYKNLGKHYLKPHEQGLISLFETINAELPKHLKKFDEAKKIFQNN